MNQSRKGAEPPDKDDDKALVRRFLALVSDLSQREIGRRVAGISQSDVSRWRNNEWEYITAAKRRALKSFVDSKEPRVPSHLGDPTGSPAEQLIYHLSHPEITRRFQDHPPMDFVKAAFAYGLEEDFSADEMSKLEAWRREVRSDVQDASD